MCHTVHNEYGVTFGQTDSATAVYCCLNEIYIQSLKQRRVEE